VLPVAQLTSSRSTGVNPLLLKAAERWRQHRQAEQTLRAREFAAINLLARQRPTMNLASAAASAQTIPSAAKVGDTLDIKVPTTASCGASIAIRAIVRLIGRRSIWLEDIGNPTGGFSTADYQELADKMDNNIFTTDSAYFGNPTDLDGNQRVGIVVTKEINKIDNILGFTSSTDQFPTAQCAASNFAEIYYGIAPDPTGQHAFGVYTLRDAKLDAPVLLAHEMTHLIQFGRRIQSGASFFTLWEAEGQATFGEEVNGHKETGRAIAQNYGFNVAFNNPQTDSIYWYVASFVDLALYYGFNTPTTAVPGAPEECGWLGQQNRNNIGPCMGGRNIYGISWSFLRWISDQFGPTFPGGEQGIQRQLINSNLQGFANIVSVINQPIDQLLAQWSAAQYMDDRVASAAARLKFTSWDLFNIENRLVTTAKLTPRARGFSDFTDNVSVRAGSTAYFRVSCTNHGPMAFSVAGAATQLPGTMRVGGKAPMRTRLAALLHAPAAAVMQRRTPPRTARLLNHRRKRALRLTRTRGLGRPTPTVRRARQRLRANPVGRARQGRRQRHRKHEHHDTAGRRRSDGRVARQPRARVAGAGGRNRDGERTRDHGEQSAHHQCDGVRCSRHKRRASVRGHSAAATKARDQHGHARCRSGSESSTRLQDLDHRRSFGQTAQSPLVRRYSITSVKKSRVGSRERPALRCSWRRASSRAWPLYPEPIGSFP
jgi:hypothetical protein